MLYDGFQCCQCQCSCHNGEPGDDYQLQNINDNYDDEEEDEIESCTEKYLTVSSGERDLHSRRVGEVEREIELIRKRKQRLARRDDRWAIRSDGVVTCAGSDRTGCDSDSYETVDRFGEYNNMTGIDRDETVDRFGGYNNMTGIDRDETVDRFGEYNNMTGIDRDETVDRFGGYNNMTGIDRDETVDRFGGYNNMTGIDRDETVDRFSDEQDMSRRLMEDANEYDYDCDSDNYETVDRFRQYDRVPRDTSTREDETVDRFAAHNRVIKNHTAHRQTKLSQNETVDRFKKHNSTCDSDVDGSETSNPPEFGLAAVGERSDDELDKVISRLETADTDVTSRSNRSTVSKPPKKEVIGEEKPRIEVRPIPVLNVNPETNPADWDPNDFKAGYIMPEKKNEKLSKPAVKSRYMEEKKVGALRNEISWGGEKSKASRYPTDGRFALDRGAPLNTEDRLSGGAEAPKRPSVAGEALQTPGGSEAGSVSTIDSSPVGAAAGGCFCYRSSSGTSDRFATNSVATEALRSILAPPELYQRASARFLNARTVPPVPYPPPPELPPKPFRREDFRDDIIDDQSEQRTASVETPSAPSTSFASSSWSPSPETLYHSIASPTSSPGRAHGGVTSPIRSIRIDSIAGENPVDVNADVEEETWLQKANTAGRHLFSRHSKSAAEAKAMAARIETLKREIRGLRKELKESQKKVLELEERQEAFWQEDVYDIVNNMSSVSSTPQSGGESLVDAATETEPPSDSNDSSSFYTAASDSEREDI